MGSPIPFPVMRSRGLLLGDSYFVTFLSHPNGAVIGLSRYGQLLAGAFQRRTEHWEPSARREQWLGLVSYWQEQLNAMCTQYPGSPLWWRLGFSWDQREDLWHQELQPDQCCPVPFAWCWGEQKSYQQLLNCHQQVPVKQALAVMRNSLGPEQHLPGYDQKNLFYPLQLWMKKSLKVEELCWMNSSQVLLELSTSNIFLPSDDGQSWGTYEGADIYPGVMRSFLMEFLKQRGQWNTVDSNRGQLMLWTNSRHFLGWGRVVFHQHELKAQRELAGGDFFPTMREAFINYLLNRLEPGSTLYETFAHH